MIQFEFNLLLLQMVIHIIHNSDIYIPFLFLLPLEDKVVLFPLLDPVFKNITFPNNLKEPKYLSR